MIDHWIHHTYGRSTSVRDNNSQSAIYLLRACYLNLHILFIAFQKSKHTPRSCFINSFILKLQVQFGSSLRRPMMTVQSDRYTKPVFLGFLLTGFGFGFFQEPPQPN